MNISCIIAASAMVLLVPFLDNSYGQSDELAPIYLILQLEIRDESGVLVGFIESDRSVILDPSILSDFLDTNFEILNKINSTFDNQQAEIFTVVAITNHSSKSHYSQSVISGASGIVALAVHDGFLINPGDTTISTWTIIRFLS